MEFILLTLLKNSIYMSVVVVLFCLINILFGSRYSARLQYNLWIIIFVALIIPFRPQIKLNNFESKQVEPITQYELIESPINSNNVITNNIATDTINVAPNINNTNITEILFYLGLIIGILGTLIIITTHILKYRSFISTVNRFSETIEDEQTLEIYKKLAYDLGLKNRPKLKYCSLISSPMLTGFKHPVILLPTNKISYNEARLFLCHELVHYKSKDLYVKVLMLITIAIHWFNPFVYLAFRESLSACEIACDTKVIELTGNTQKKSYIDAIMSAISKEKNFKLSLSTYFYGGKEDMKKRFLSILENRKKAYLPAIFGAFVVTTGILSSNVTFVDANTITSEKATQIALAKTGGGTVTKCKLDYDDGVMIYEIEIYNNNIEYDIDLNATNSQIIKYEQETIKTLPAVSQPSSNEINPEKAKSIALAKTGGGTVLKWEMDFENGIRVYEIEILNGNNKYDLDIGATDSKIYNFKQQPVKVTGTNNYTSKLTVGAKEIKEAKAKEIALAKSGGGSILSCILDYENGRKVYEIVAVNNNIKYEMDIATTDGAIHDYEEKVMALPQTPAPKAPTTQAPVVEPPVTQAPSTNNATQISTEKAKQIALGKTSGGTVVKCKLDTEDGVKVYEVEIINGSYEYSMDINATTGEVTDFEKEYED